MRRGGDEQGLRQHFLRFVQKQRRVAPVRRLGARLLPDIQRFGRPPDFLHLSQQIERGLRAMILVQQAAPDGSIVIGAVQRLLKTPVLEQRGCCLSLNILKAGKRDRNPFVRR